MTDSPQTPLSPAKQALLKIRELKQRLAELESGGGPIAVVSMACRFPRRSDSPEAFWQSLVERTEQPSDIPDDRWELDAFYDEDPEAPGKMYARRGVFLEGLDRMDPEFFGISPREATWVDPQQRLLMEAGWEALERAAWRPEQIGERTGVFVGWMHNDYQNEASDSFLNLNPYIATGAAGSFLCGRLAYYLGLNGPSVAIDTACSSSLVALHLACQSLLRGECDRALAGGVNAIVSPTTNILTCKLKALSPHGHSRAFDAAADGYLRGEGCGVVTLRRLADAQRDGDPIVGVIRGSAVGHNGFSSGLTAPNPKAQEAVIREALSRAGVAATDVAYLEAHGTGTELGDPIEVQAAGAALAGGRDAKNPLLIGSVKTNIGHLEAAAGMAGLIKTLLSLEKGSIPPQLNFETPNPHIPWERLPVEVVTEQTAWPDAAPRLAGVSAFGMSGTNAHVVVEAAPTSPGRARVNGTAMQGSGASPELLLLSGVSATALEELAERYADSLGGDSATLLADAAYTSCVGRSHLDERAAIVVRSRSEAVDALKSLARGARSDHAVLGKGRRRPKVAWQFTGQGSQFVGMGRGLYASQPVFREAIDSCESLLQDWRGESLTKVLFEDPDLVNHTSWTQPAIFAVQMGLANLLQHWGLQPDAVMGHSVGQYAAACVAGVIPWEDGLRLISERGRLIGDLPPGGKMLAVFGSADAARGELENNPALSLAALNGTHAVVSGPAEAVDQAATRLTEAGVRSKPLTTSHAFHSSLMDPALAPFQAVADTVEYAGAAIPLVCNVTGEALPADFRFSGEYWARHIREPVQYAAGLEAVQELGCGLVLELGPQSTLTRMAAAGWRGQADALVNCLDRGVDDEQALLHALARLHVQGESPDFDRLYAGSDRQRVLLPTYPFQRRRFWGPDKPRAAHAEFHTAHPLLGAEVSLAGVSNETRYEGFVEPDGPPWLPDHRVMGNTVVPGAAYLEMALAAADSGSGAVAQAVFEQPLTPTSRTALQTVLKTVDGERRLECYSSAANSGAWNRHFTATLVTAPPADAAPARVPLDREQIEVRCPRSADAAEFYARLAGLDLEYGPAFQVIDSLRYSEDEVLAQMSVKGDLRGYRVPPTLLDGALHAMAAGLLVDDDNDSLPLPVKIERLAVLERPEGNLWCHGVWRAGEESARKADIRLYNEAGQLCVEVLGLEVQRVDRAVLRRMSGASSAGLTYHVDWQPFRLGAETQEPTRWLVVSQGGTEEAFPGLVAEQLAARGHSVRSVQMLTGEDFTHNESKFCVCPESAEHWNQLVAGSSEPGGSIDGIVWCCGGKAVRSDDPWGDAKVHCSGLLNLISALQAQGQRRLECGLTLVTTGGVAAEADDLPFPEQTQYWGLGRVIGAEEPGLRCRLVDLSAGDANPGTSAERVTDLLLTETHDSQFALRDQQLLTARLQRTNLQRATEASNGPKAGAAYLITGGLGMLGREAAAWLAGNGAEQVVLVSRREPAEETAELLDQLRRNGCEVVVHNADMGDADQVRALIGRFGDDLLPLAGVIHAAGVLDDALLGDQTWERFEKVLAPKITGARLLDQYTRDEDLDFFVLYSSAASVLGSPGQSNYATANAYLDGLAWQRRAEGLPCLSINWGPWTLGMADDERIAKRLAMQGITALSVEDAHNTLQRLLDSGAAQATVIDADWRRMQRGLVGESPPLLAEVTPRQRQSKAADSALVLQLRSLKGAAKKDLLVKTIQDSLAGILSTADKPETDRPLIEMGLDSLMAVEFGAELQQMLGDQFAVGPTMLFDHPTIDAIADHVQELVAATGESEPTSAESDQPPAEPKPIAAREDVAIIGMACRFPGAEDLDQFWQNLLNGVDSVREIPDDRWDTDRFFSSDAEPGKMYTREGGFLEDIGDFDAGFFNIPENEACWIDPQHRMLLENSHRALEDAGVASYPLEDANVGVFMGIMGQDYAFLPSLDDEHIIRAFQGAGLSHSAGVGRISYAFGFEGPSIAVDTASSSSLVALYQAVRSLQDGNCNMALAGGVNAILAPVNSLLMSKAQLLSPDGRCKSFSASADGFGRGEGCGVVVLKRLGDAQRDGDRIMAVVRGGAVVHNGFSGGITTPSGKAQGRVIGEALRDAGVAPSQVQYLEAHGTGTEYGDPMELAAAASVYGKGRQPDAPLLVGSVKANISHLEAAGGVSGLIKTVLALHHGVIPGQLHFEEPSPHVPWSRLPLRVVSEQTAWPEAEQRTAAVTALGLVGTNAHVIVSGPPAPSDDQRPKPDSRASKPLAYLLPVSARSETSLQQLASSYRDSLLGRPELSIADVCHTLGIGRRHFEYRAGLVVSSLEDAAEQLGRLSGEATPGANGVVHSLANGNGRLHANGSAAAPSKARYHRSAPKIGWVFDGRESHAPETARALYSAESVFREMVGEFDQRLAEHDQVALKLTAWFESDSESLPSEHLTFCVMAGLARVWRSWGIEPELAMGVGVGQFAAASVAGCLSDTDAWVLVHERDAVRERLAATAGAIPNEGELPAEIQADIDRFEALADTFNYYPPNLPLVCSIDGEIVPVHRSPAGGYWRRHLSADPKVDAAYRLVGEADCEAVLSFGGRRVDEGNEVEESRAADGPAWLTAADESAGVVESMLQSLAMLYEIGAAPEFGALSGGRPRKKLSLPTYRFQKKRYWITEIPQDADDQPATLVHGNADR
ncbi:MAG: SDR family NAD(P)-dependent oxidoreductase [Planctomycetota bacterium]